MRGLDGQGAGILLAASSTEALQAASLAIKQALPPICSGCLLVLQVRVLPQGQGPTLKFHSLLGCCLRVYSEGKDSFITNPPP